ncbi:MAG: VCBS repeat-containing protein [Planctomycetota bacterium]|nr:VCBS repeat-containing protein [Planctomycetota bacterium]
MRSSHSPRRQITNWNAGVQSSDVANVAGGLSIPRRSGICSAILLLALCVAACRPDSDTSSKNDGTSADQAREDRLASAELDEDRQQEIWEAESVTFQMERRFGFRLKTAIMEGDQSFIRSAFGENSVIAITSASPVINNQAGIEEIKIQTVGPEDMTPISVEALATQFIDDFSAFESVDGSSFRVLKIKRRSPELPTWDAEILISVRGDAADGLRKEVTWIQNVEVDYFDDQPLDETASFKRWSIVSKKTSTGQQEIFIEITRESLLEEAYLPDNWEVDVEKTEQYRFQYAVEDFDADGRLDIAVAVMDGPPFLLKHYPDGTFRQVALERGIQVSRPLENFCCCWLDFDNDNDPDLVLGDRVYQNDDGVFRDVTEASQLAIDPFCMGAVVADYDLDGDQDIYVIYQVDLSNIDAEGAQWVDDRMTGKANRLWQNDGAGHFKDVTAESRAGSGGRHTHAAAWFHFDDDLYPDLYVANDFGLNVVLKNNGDGTFSDVTSDSDAGGYSTSMGVATGDLDNNGTNDIYVANMFSKMGRRIIAYVSEEDYPDGIYEQIVGSCAGNQLYSRNTGTSPFTELSEDSGINGVGWAFGPAMADFDNDGLLDIYATTGFMSFDRTKPDG